MLRRLCSFSLVCLAACGTPNKTETPSSSPDASTLASTSTSASTTAQASTAAVPDVPNEPATPPPGPAKEADVDPTTALAAAKKDGKPALVVFCAKWVAACGELAHVLADPGVKKTLDERFVVTRVDVSNEDDPTTKERMKRYAVKGLPCMVVFDRKGKEVAREMSYLDAPRLSKLLDRAK